MKNKNFIFAKRQKFGAKKQTIDGRTYDSRLEAGYAGQLKMEKRCKLIKDFECQVSFDLFAWEHKAIEGKDCKRKVCTHLVDFLVTNLDGTYEVREVKGFATSVWDLKRKLFEANYPNIPYKVVR
jgi:hypothetical protein